MRSRFLLYLVVSLLLAAVTFTPAHADFGAGVLLSWGTDKVSWTSKLMMYEEGSDREITPENGVVRPSRDKAILGQIVFTKDGNVNPNDFRFSFSTLATPRDGDWKNADFDSKLGWTFRIDPNQYVPGSFSTPLHLRVWVNRGEQKFIRIIFRFNIGRDLGGVKDTISREVLFIRPWCPTQDKPGTVANQMDANTLALASAIAALEKNQQAIAADNAGAKTAADALTARIERLEKWAEQMTARSSSPAAKPATADVRIVFPTSGSRILVIMTSSNSYAYPVKGQVLHLPTCGVGHYTVRLQGANAPSRMLDITASGNYHWDQLPVEGSGNDAL